MFAPVKERLADIDATTKWVVKEYADDPSMQRATNKDRLARNIITIGGSGDQQQLNMVAFQQALAQHAEEQRRKAVNTEAAKAAEFAAQLDKASPKSMRWRGNTANR